VEILFPFFFKKEKIATKSPTLAVTPPDPESANGRSKINKKAPRKLEALNII